MKIGLISGHRVPNLLIGPEKIPVETPFGDIMVETSSLGDHELFFINRHGEKSNLPPHKVNYLGNIQAFASSHVDCILAVGTVGSIKKNIVPGDFVVPDDFIDFTKSRPYTFFDEERVHVPLLIYPHDKHKDDKKYMRPIKYHSIWFLPVDEQEALDHIDLEYKG